MSIQFIDRRCTVNVHPTSNGYSFEYGGKIHKSRTEKGVHNFFLREYSSNRLDTVKLRFNDKKYYLHFTLDEPEKFSTKRALRSILAQENEGAWIEEKNGKQRYFVDKGWLFSTIEEVSEEEYSSKQSFSVMQRADAFISKIALGVFLQRTIVNHIPPHFFSFGLMANTLTSLSLVRAQSPFCGEFRINNQTLDTIETPILTNLPDGGFVTAWLERVSAHYEVFVRIYNDSAVPLGSEFALITNATITNQIALAALRNGELVAAWTVRTLGYGYYNIFANWYSATGSVLEPDILVSTNSAIYYNQYPALIGLMQGGCVVAWQDTNQYDLYGQIYDSQRIPIGSVFKINTDRLRFYQAPALASLINGDFVAAWYGSWLGWGIFGQLIKFDGTRIGSAFRIDSNETRQQQDVVLAGLVGGGFVAAWMGFQTANWNIYGREYNTLLIPIGPEFQITFNISAGNPDITSLMHGGFVVTCIGYLVENTTIYGKLYNTSESPFKSELSIASYGTNMPINPTITSLKDGGFVLVWVNTRMINSSIGEFDIYGLTYNVNGVPIVNCAMITPTSVLSNNMPQSSDIAQASSLPPSSSTNSPSFLSSSLVPSSTLPMTTAFGSSDSAPQASITYPSITSLSYETTYSITLNGLDIGTFIFSGGTGLFDGTLSNTITLNIDPDLVGETFTLFTIPSGQEGDFRSIELVGVSCQSFDTQIVQDGTAQTFQAIFQGTTCSNAMRSQGVFLKV